MERSAIQSDRQSGNNAADCGDRKPGPGNQFAENAAEAPKERSDQNIEGSGFGDFHLNIITEAFSEIHLKMAPQFSGLNANFQEFTPPIGDEG